MVTRSWFGPSWHVSLLFCTEFPKEIVVFRIYYLLYWTFFCSSFFQMVSPFPASTVQRPTTGHCCWKLFLQVALRNFAIRSFPIWFLEVVLVTSRLMFNCLYSALFFSFQSGFAHLWVLFVLYLAKWLYTCFTTSSKLFIDHLPNHSYPMNLGYYTTQMNNFWSGLFWVLRLNVCLVF